MIIIAKNALARPVVNTSHASGKEIAWLKNIVTKSPNIRDIRVKLAMFSPKQPGHESKHIIIY